MTLSSLPAPLAFPQCEKGIGSVISSAESNDLIQDVKVQPGVLWPDDRGYFLEVARIGKGLTASFANDSLQVSSALSYPGTIKAFHYHQRQTDVWVPVAGMLQVALVDLRPAASTFGRRNTFYVGSLRPWHILIPPGIAHGYKIIGSEPAILVYLTNQFYDPTDEGRIPHNHPSLQYDWETQYK